MLLALLRGVTQNEALNLSIFVLEILTDLCRWAESEETYKSECVGSPCFAKNYLQAESPSVSYEGFVKVLLESRSESRCTVIGSNSFL